ncbi:MAG: energy transducer TonB [Acidobacteriota bacterium]|nr:energy transducer TonB [Acidobacteriota bacterium]
MFPRATFLTILATTLALSPAAAQQLLTETEAATLEANVQSNPDDAAATLKLYNYYQQGSADPNWSRRFALASYNIQHHPDSALFSRSDIWQIMPKPLREQIKPMWIAQVHQHADNPAVLRNAANGLSAPDTSSIRVGGRVADANILLRIQPQYPPLARQARIQGTVRFNVVIGQDGHLQNLQLVSGHPLLVQAAQEALTQWTYKPTLLNGNPVPVITTVDINFSLSDSSLNESPVPAALERR